MAEIKLTVNITTDTQTIARIVKMIKEEMKDGEMPVMHVPTEKVIEKDEPVSEKDKQPVTTAAEPDVVPWEEDDKPTPTLEEIRALLADKSRSGHSAEVKALISKYGADKLSEVDPSKYPQMFKEAEAIGNAK